MFLDLFFCSKSTSVLSAHFGCGTRNGRNLCDTMNIKRARLSQQWYLVRNNYIMFLVKGDKNVFLICMFFFDNNVLYRIWRLFTELMWDMITRRTTRTVFKYYYKHEIWQTKLFLYFRQKKTRLDTRRWKGIQNYQLITMMFRNKYLEHIPVEYILICSF